MAKTFGSGDEQISNYALEAFHPLDEKLEKILELSTKSGLPQIQVGPMDGLHLEVLTRAFGARKAVEIGTLGGYSATCIARGLREGGKLYCFEVNADNAEVAKKAWAIAGVQDRVEIIVGPATTNFSRIENEGPFDLVFIDADKFNYMNYLKWAESHLRVGGALLADNTFAFGHIADPNYSGEQGPSVKVLREFNHALAHSARWRSTILPTGEGLTFAVKVK